MSQRKKLAHQRELDAAVRPCARQRRPVRCLSDRCERGCARREVDWPPVIGIDQRQIPELGALIEIGNSRQRRLQDQLGQTIERPHQRCAPRECVEAVNEDGGSLAIEKTPDKIRQASLVRLIGGEPTRLLLALARGFDSIGLHPLDELRLYAAERPSAEQCLIEHIFVRRRRYPRGAGRDGEVGVELPPPVHASRPFVRKLSKREQPRACVLAAFCVVRRGCGQAMRPFGGAFLHTGVEALDRQRAGGRIAADLVERQQAVKPIEGGILQRLRHHRTGELLNLEREAAIPCDAVA